MRSRTIGPNQAAPPQRKLTKKLTTAKSIPRLSRSMHKKILQTLETLWINKMKTPRNLFALFNL